MHQEGPLYPNAVSDAPHGNVLVGTAFRDLDNRSLEYLYPLTVSFYDTDVNPHRVARKDIRKVILDLLLSDAIQNHAHVALLNTTKRRTASPLCYFRYLSRGVYHVDVCGRNRSCTVLERGRNCRSA